MTTQNDKAERMKDLIPYENVERRIFLIRGHKVMIDRDLAELYGVKTKYLNRQVRFNSGRFPAQFMFRLTKNERDELVHFCHRFESMKHSSAMPYAFTEHGVAMLASVLNSDRAIRVSIAIIKAFIKLREIAVAHKDIMHKLSDLERRMDRHDKELRSIFEAIRQLMASPPEPPKRRIGFRSERKWIMYRVPSAVRRTKYAILNPSAKRSKISFEIFEQPSGCSSYA